MATKAKAEMKDFVLTTGSLARLAGVLPETVREYGDLGLIEQRRTPAGVRLYRADSAPKVRRVLAERLARKGGRKT